jgi:hypothetical protein
VTRPLLTVGVPTWNRAELLRDTLRSVVEQADRHGLSGQVEVLVCDNASTDDTEQAVAAIAESTATPVRYHRAAENGGPVRNVLRTLELARGEFWMFYGDDDVMTPDALPRILSALREQAECDAFLFQQQPAHPDFALADGFAVSAVEGAERFFYYAGNAGVFALRTEPAQAVLAREGVDGFQTPWPQTQLIFSVLGTSARPKPLYAAPFPVSASPHHAANTVHSSMYVWETAVDGLYRTALALERTSPPVAAAAARHVFSPRRVRELAVWLGVAAAFQEPAADARRTRAAVRARLRSLPARVAATALPLLLAVTVPGPAARGMLTGWIRLRRPRDEADRVIGGLQEARRAYLSRAAEAVTAEGNVRDYTRTGF